MSFFCRIRPGRVGAPASFSLSIVVPFVFSRILTSGRSFHSTRCPDIAPRSSGPNSIPPFFFCDAGIRHADLSPASSFVADSMLRILAFLHPASASRHHFFVSSAHILPSKYPGKCKFPHFSPIFTVFKPPKRFVRSCFKHFLQRFRGCSIFLM